VSELECKTAFEEAFESFKAVMAEKVEKLIPMEDEDVLAVHLATKEESLQQFFNRAVGDKIKGKRKRISSSLSKIHSLTPPKKKNHKI
jgi:hypothetical protein